MAAGIGPPASRMLAGLLGLALLGGVAQPMFRAVSELSRVAWLPAVWREGPPRGPAGRIEEPAAANSTAAVRAEAQATAALLTQANVSSAAVKPDATVAPLTEANVSTAANPFEAVKAGANATAALLTEANVSTAAVKQAKRRDSRFALCIVGNIRTFPLTFSSLEDFSVRNDLETYMVLSKGQATGSDWLAYRSMYFDAAVEQRLIEELQRRAERPTEGQMAVRKVIVVERGNCEEYNRVFAPHEHTFSSVCREDATHAQLRYVRTCFSAVLASPTRYDLVVRTRPDVGIFAPLQLSQFKPYPEAYGIQASWKYGAPRFAGDWFYMLPGSKLYEYWSMVERVAATSFTQWPVLDYTQFQFANARNWHFPVVIVRHDHFAECCRFQEGGNPVQEGLWKDSKTGPEVEAQCREAVAGHRFARPASFLNLSAALPFQEARFCNVFPR